jgi:iron complex outermembrane receptor protein
MHRCPSRRGLALGAATLACLLVVPVFSQRARAQQLAAQDAGGIPPLAAAGSDAGVVPIASYDDVTVRESKTGPLGGGEVLTSSHVLGADLLQNQTAAETLHLLKRVPAVYMSDFNQGVTTTGVAVRGFNTEGEVAHIKLLIDGIPSNFHGGNPELKSVFPLEIDTLAVVMGTNDARYGINNVAGNINVTTRHGEDVQLARVLGGSFGTIEPQLLAGVRTGDFNQTYFIGYRSTQGYRDNARMQRYAGSGKWFYEPSARLSVGLIARAMHLEAESPGFLRADEWRARPRSAPDYARDDAGEQTNLHLSAHLDLAARRGLSLSAKAYAQSFERDRFVRFDPADDQMLRREDERQYGGIVVLTYRASGPRAHGFMVEWGADYQGQDNLNIRAASDARVTREPRTRDHAFTFHALGSYLQASVKPWRPLKLVAAVRADYLAGELHDRIQGAHYDLGSYGVIWQPKLSGMLHLAEGQRLYANYGRTFQVGTGIGGYQTGDRQLKPSINDGWEAGLRAGILPWLTARVAVWQQLASREVRTRPVDAVLEQIGKTNRYGLDLEATITPTQWLSLWGSFSPVAALQREPGSAYPGRRGKTLNEVPWYSAKGGIDYRRVQSLLVSLWAYAQGSYYLTKDNDGPRQGAYVTLNLDANYQVTPQVGLGVQLLNLLDTTYDQAAWFKDYGEVGSMHSPGPPLSAFASVTLTL